MENGYRLIDSDAHVIEPADLFEKYLEPRFRSPLPVAWSEYSGEPLAFRFKLVIPGAGGAEHSMPFGRDPLNDERRARFGGLSSIWVSRWYFQDMSRLIWSSRSKDSPRKLTPKRWNGPVSTIWWCIRPLGY